MTSLNRNRQKKCIYQSKCWGRAPGTENKILAFSLYLYVDGGACVLLIRVINTSDASIEIPLVNVLTNLFTYEATST